MKYKVMVQYPPKPLPAIPSDMDTKIVRYVHFQDASTFDDRCGECGQPYPCFSIRSLRNLDD